MNRILSISLAAVFFAAACMTACSYADLSDREADTYDEMTSSIDNESFNDGPEDSKNDQIRLIGDEHGMTDQDARELYERGEANEFDD